jgi:site-specific DNA-methyltransferase (adenine-specific)
MYSDANTYGDEGGASRFFYCPKASKKDRNEGCDELEDKGYSINQAHNSKTLEERYALTSKNNHPTVKPTDLCAYLIRLVTPKGGVVLDPFMGSGSTGKAAVREGMNFIGIEREEEYMEIAKSRIEYEQKKNKHREFFI